MFVHQELLSQTVCVCSQTFPVNSKLLINVCIRWHICVQNVCHLNIPLFTILYINFLKSSKDKPYNRNLPFKKAKPEAVQGLNKWLEPVIKKGQIDIYISFTEADANRFLLIIF